LVVGRTVCGRGVGTSDSVLGGCGNGDAHSFGIVDC
jgi:hypothetical protein